MTIKTASNVRGVTDIRTHSGMAHSMEMPHVAYLRIGSLEIEKFRRNQEKQSAAARIKDVDERIAAIEAEKQLILEKMGERDGAAPKVGSRKQKKTRGRNHPSGNGKEPFKLKY